jgi:drug/metabolite transporter (DMT)-like permease
MLDKRTGQILGYAFILFTGVMFGSLEVASKLIAHINPFQLNFTRFFIGAIVVMPFALLELKSKKIRVSLRDIAYNALLGVLLVCFSMTLAQVGISKVPASQVAFIFSANPMIIAILAAFILKEKPNLLTYVFIALGMIGIVFIADPFKGAFDPDVLYPLAAVTLFGIYIVLARKLSRKIGSIFVTGAAIFFGTIGLGVFNLITGSGLFSDIRQGDILTILFIGVFISGLSYVTYFKGMELTTTSTGSVTFFLKAMTATVLSIVVLKDTPSVATYIGASFILAGTIVLIISNHKAKAKA